MSHFENVKPGNNVPAKKKKKKKKKIKNDYNALCINSKGVIRQ